MGAQLTCLSGQPPYSHSSYAPLTVDQLRHIYEKCVRSDLDRVLWDILILSFRSLLRKSNLAPDTDKVRNHVVLRRDVVVHDWGIMLLVRSTKTLQCQEYVLEIPIYS